MIQITIWNHFLRPNAALLTPTSFLVLLVGLIYCLGSLASKLKNFLWYFYKVGLLARFSHCLPGNAFISHVFIYFSNPRKDLLSCLFPWFCLGDQVANSSAYISNAFTSCFLIALHCKLHCFENFLRTKHAHILLQMKSASLGRDSELFYDLLLSLGKISEPGLWSWGRESGILLSE